MASTKREDLLRPGPFGYSFCTFLAPLARVNKKGTGAQNLHEELFWRRSDPLPKGVRELVVRCRTVLCAGIGWMQRPLWNIWRATKLQCALHLRDHLLCGLTIVRSLLLCHQRHQGANNDIKKTLLPERFWRPRPPAAPL